MTKVIVFTLVGIFLLFGGGLLAGWKVFEPWDRLLMEAEPGAPDLAPGEMSWNNYKKIKLALGSFDLANGLTKKELETIHLDRSLGFYYLLVCLWLSLGLRFGLGRPLKRRKPRAEDD